MHAPKFLNLPFLPSVPFLPLLSHLMVKHFMLLRVKPSSKPLSAMACRFRACATKTACALMATAAFAWSKSRANARWHQAAAAA